MPNWNNENDLARLIELTMRNRDKIPHKERTNELLLMLCKRPYFNDKREVVNWLTGKMKAAEDRYSDG